MRAPILMLFAVTGCVVDEYGEELQEATVAVTASVETDPVAHSGDAADDPSIWVHPTDATRSLVIGTDKQGALEVYDLAGKRLQRITGTSPNNVDLRGNLVVTADDEASRMRFYTVDPSTRKLTAIGTLNAGVTEHGICMYKAANGKLYAFPNSTSGKTEQWEVWIDGSGTIAGQKVRGPWSVTSGAIEGCVADDATGALYIAEEDGELWRYGAAPTDSTSTRTEIGHAGDGNLIADIEGLAIVGDHLIASSQGDNGFVVYRKSDGAFVRKVTVATGTLTDGCSDTDGIEASNVSFGGAFASGLFICQDGSNGSPASGNQNFKYVALDKILGSAPPPPPPPGDNLVLNPGFESGTASWTTTSGVVTNDSGNAHAGSWFAWLCGYGTAHVDTATQALTLPSAGAVTLSFWLDIDSAESSTSTAYDTLKVQIVLGGATTTVATYSNLDETSGYVQKTLDLTAFAGSAVTLKLAASEDSGDSTGFQIDDVAIVAN